MNPKPPEGPPTTSPEKAPKILSFKEFTRYDTQLGLFAYKNFYFYFLEGFVGNAKRGASWYKVFEKDHGNLATLLREKFKELSNKLIVFSQEDLKPLNRDLYKAYKIMRSYGASDTELIP